jgi:hypothetical protein
VRCAWFLGDPEAGVVRSDVIDLDECVSGLDARTARGEPSNTPEAGAFTASAPIPPTISPARTVSPMRRSVMNRP